MWIDLLSWKDGSRVPLAEAIQQLTQDYEKSLVAEQAEVAQTYYDFRHAIVFMTSAGHHVRKTEKLDELAGQFLLEYGRACGGTPCGFDSLTTRDYGQAATYMMAFMGGPTEPTVETRLKAEPNLPTATGLWVSLLGHEEVVVV